MTVPTSYTEVTLKTYMHAVLGATAGSIGWDSVSTHYDEAVYQTLFDYGVSDITDATNIQKLRALARVQAWKAALNEVAGDYSFSDGGASYNRSHLHDHITKQLQMVTQEAMSYLPDYTIEVEDVDYLENPYEWYEADDRVEMR